MKPIPQFPQYFATEDGRIYSSKTQKYLTLHTYDNGYLYTTLSDRGTSAKFLVHRLVAQAYLSLDLFSELEVHHIDEVRSNNNLYNLEVLSYEQHLQKTLKAQGKQRRVVREPLVKQPQINTDIKQEDIEYWVLKFSWTRAQKELGLSDNGLRKRYKTLTGLDPKSIKKRV